MKNNNHPSQKIYIMIALALIIVVVAFVIKNANNKARLANENFQGHVLQLSEIGWEAEAFMKDSDGDGLKDWEEALWGTDPHNPDTSGDGISDGEKVAMGRDPRLPYPDDELLPENTPAYLRVYDEPSETQRFTQEFFAEFRQLANSGRLTQEAFRNLMNRLSQKYNSPLLIDDRYLVSDLQVTISTEANIRSYGNELGRLTEKYSNIKAQSEIAIIQSALLNNDPTVLEELENIIEMYKAGLNDLVSVPVPADLVDLHLNMLNSLNRVIFSLEEGAVNLFDDPVKGTSHMGLFANEIAEFYGHGERIKEYFFANNIIFNPSEDGYLFMSFF